MTGFDARSEATKIEKLYTNYTQSKDGVTAFQALQSEFMEIQKRNPSLMRDVAKIVESDKLPFTTKVSRDPYGDPVLFEFDSAKNSNGYAPIRLLREKQVLRAEEVAKDLEKGDVTGAQKVLSSMHIRNSLEFNELSLYLRHRLPGQIDSGSTCIKAVVMDGFLFTGKRTAHSPESCEWLSASSHDDQELNYLSQAQPPLHPIFDHSKSKK